MDEKKLSNLEKHTVLCPHCGKKVLDHMTECPFCKEKLNPEGYKPMDEKTKKRVKIVLWILLGAVAVLLIVLSINGII